MESLYLKALGGGRLRVLPGLSAKRIGQRVRAGLEEALEAYRTAARRCERKATPKRVKAARKRGRRLLAALELAGLIGVARHVKRLSGPLKRQVRALGEVRDCDMLRALLRMETGAQVLPDAAAKVARKLDRQLQHQRHREADRLVKRLKRLELKPIEGCFGKAARKAVDREAVNRALAEAFAQAAREHPRPGGDPHLARKALKRYHERLLPLHGVLPPDQVDELRPRIDAALGRLHDDDLLLAKWEAWVGRKRKRRAAAFPLTALFRGVRAAAGRQVESFPGFGPKPTPPVVTSRRSSLRRSSGRRP